MKTSATIFSLAMTIVFCLRCVSLAEAGVEKSVIIKPKWDLGRPVRIALLPVQADADHQEAARLVRRILYGQLLSIPELRVIEPVAVDTILSQEGLENRDKWDEGSIRGVGRALKVDYLLLPDLTTWHQRYMVLQSRTAVGIHARIVDAETGEAVWAAECEASFGKGLTGVPTGATALALEPLRGMRKRYLYDCAYQAAQGLIDCLQPQRPRKGNRHSKPTALSGPSRPRRKDRAETVPVLPGPPTIDSVSAAFEDRILTLEMAGTAGCHGSFLLDDPGRLFPVSEVASGRYRGQYRFPPGAPDPTHLTVRLVRPNGQATVAETRW